MSAAPPPFLEGVAAVAAISLAAAAARALSIRWLPDAPRSLRLTGAGVLWVALLVAGLRLLGAASSFGAIPALVLFAIVAFRIASGEHLVPTSSPLPFFAYPFAVLGFVGWIVTILKRRSA